MGKLVTPGSEELEQFTVKQTNKKGMKHIETKST